MKNKVIYSVERETFDESDNLLFEVSSYETKKEANDYNGHGVDIVYLDNSKRKCQILKNKLNKLRENGMEKIREDQLNLINISKNKGC